MATVVTLVIGAVIVFVIAAVAVGRVTSRLATSPERAVYDVDQSLEFVAAALPDEVTARLSYDDVGLILRLLHDHLHAEGIATTAGEDDRAEGPAVFDPDIAADRIVARAALADLDVQRSDAEAVIAAQVEYFAAIGALGGRVDGPDDPA